MHLPPSDTPELDSARNILSQDPARALKAAQNYFAAHPKSSPAALLIYQAHNRLGNWQDALEAANTYVSLRPDKALPYTLRGEMSYRLGRYSDAIFDAKHAISIDYDGVAHSVPHRLLSLSYAAQGDKINAVAAAESMPELENDEWCPPIGPIPAGTKKQYIETMRRLAEFVASKQ